MLSGSHSKYDLENQWNCSPRCKRIRCFFPVLTRALPQIYGLGQWCSNWRGPPGGPFEHRWLDPTPRFLIPSVGLGWVPGPRWYWCGWSGDRTNLGLEASLHCHKYGLISQYVHLVKTRQKLVPLRELIGYWEGVKGWGEGRKWCLWLNKFRKCWIKKKN